MITRAQDKALTGKLSMRKQPRLTALERAMLQWAVVDPDDRLLDANIGSGLMAEYLRRNMQCEVCGVSCQMEHVRIARSRLQSCDIVYAQRGDIPWRDDAFDTVLLKLEGEEPELLKKMLSEAHRVLRPGGQLILGTFCLPWALESVASLLIPEVAAASISRQHLIDLTKRTNFSSISWQRTGLRTCVLIGWKGKGEEVEN